MIRLPQPVPLAAAILAPLLALPLVTRPAPTAPGRAAAGAHAISAAALEAEHGLRITRVSVTGGGGLVDLRFTVTDPARARPLLEDPGRSLALLAGGARLAAPHHGALRSVRLAKDAPCFVLFPNTRRAVRPGQPVSVAFGDLQAGPVAAR